MELGQLRLGGSWHILDDATNHEIKVGFDLYKTGCDLWLFDGSLEMKSEAIRFFRQASEYKNINAANWLDRHWAEVLEIDFCNQEPAPSICASSTDHEMDAADLYSQGIACWEANGGKEQDIVSAVFYMEQASKLGSSSAKYWLDTYSETARSYTKGWNYMNGSHGMRQNLHRALVHFKAASKGGHKDAEQFVQFLKRGLEES